MAEVKPFKVGEAAASNVGGNPEPSSSNEQACVETRRKVCIKCGMLILNKSRKYCSDACRSAYTTQQFRIRHGLIELPGVGSGNNQLREKNHQWKGGVASFAKIARETQNEICNWCGSKEHLVVHHIDHDRKNNIPENLVIICKKCHQKHHTIRNTKTGKYTKG